MKNTKLYLAIAVLLLVATNIFWMMRVEDLKVAFRAQAKQLQDVQDCQPETALR